MIGCMQRNWMGFLIGMGTFFATIVSARTAELREVAVWNFNAPGVFQASQGSGEARILGGVSVTNLTGSPSDPLSPNASLGLRGFPPQGTVPRSAGVEFVLADAFSRLQLSFDVRVSPTACSRLAVLVGQGAGDFVEAGTLEVTQDGVFIPMSLDLSGVLDPLSSGSTRIRIVADSRPDGLYPTVKPKPDGTSSYGPSGVWRLDRVVFCGVVQETSGESLRISVSTLAEDLHLDWTHPRLDQFTLWNSPSPEGPWSIVGILYDLHRIVPVDGPMRFYRVTSP